MAPEELLARRDCSVIISTVDAKEEILQILEDGEYPKELIFTLDGYSFAVNDQYFGPDFLSYQEGEVFLDVGCCNLRSSIALREHCKKVKKVYAFEPKPESFEVCQRNKKKYNFPEAELIPYGAWSEETELKFETNKSNPAASCICDLGGVVIPVKPIDSVIPLDEQVTFIKMDIEGAELQALKGAKKTIRRCRPKLAICIYHKPEDMTQLPLYIHSIVPEYKFYIRHHSNYYGETVLYAV